MIADRRCCGCGGIRAPPLAVGGRRPPAFRLSSSLPPAAWLPSVDPRCGATLRARPRRQARPHQRPPSLGGGGASTSCRRPPASPPLPPRPPWRRQAVERVAEPSNSWGCASPRGRQRRRGGRRRHLHPLPEICHVLPLHSRRCGDGGRLLLLRGHLAVSARLLYAR